jgi:hypothetical protein
MSFRNRFYVNWDDPAFPLIEEVQPGSSHEGVSLQAAKLEITRRAQGLISHWREILRHTRSLTARSVAEQGRIYQPKAPTISQEGQVVDGHHTLQYET